MNDGEWIPAGREPHEIAWLVVKNAFLVCVVMALWNACAHRRFVDECRKEGVPPSACEMLWREVGGMK